MRQELLKPGKVIPENLTLDKFNEIIKTSEDYAKSFPIYKTIVNAMERKYSWLGRQVAEDLLDSIAMSVIDKCYDLPYRGNQHVLLIWDSGWFKSSMLSDFLSMMPSEYFGGIGKITDASLRGTVETAAKPGSRFVAPPVLDYDFLIVREFGEGLTEDNDLRQTLLTVLEDQVVNVSLAKFAQLDAIERTAVELRYGANKFKWTSNSAFTYKTKVTLWCANYTPVENEALLNRFNIVNPRAALDESLRDHVMMHPYLELKLEPGVSPPFDNIRDAVDAMMGANRPPLPVAFDLRGEFKGIRGLAPRTHSNVIKKILAAAWWGFWLDSDVVRGMAMEGIMAKTESLKRGDDDIIDMLKTGWHTINDIAAEKGVSHKAVWSLLNQIKDKPFVIIRKRDTTDRRKIYVHLVENTQTMVKPPEGKGEVVDLDTTKTELVGRKKKEGEVDGEK